MRRAARIGIGIAAACVAVFAFVIVFLLTFDLNHVKPWVEKKVSAATHRTFLIGDLALSWQRPPHERSWRRFLPWPHLRARNVELSNADWSSVNKEMAEIKQVDFNINPFLLLGKTVDVESFIMTEPSLLLEQDRKGQNNWTFSRQESSSGWHVVLQDVAMTRGTIRYVDPVKHADMVLRMDTHADNSVEWKLGGKYNDEPITGDAKTGSLLSIQATGVPYPVEGKVVVGQTTVLVKGSITDPAHPSAIDANLKILGASMADLFPLSGVLLPETPKFSTEGRVVGTLGRGNLRLRYENFKGQVGTSDINGTLEYLQRNPRPLLDGDVESKHLNLHDLATLIGAGAGPKKQKSDEVRQPPDKILPVSPFKTDRWGKMDAQVQFNGNEIVGATKLPLENVHTFIKMQDGVLSLEPLDFGIADGKLTTQLRIDGRSNPAKAKVDISARHLKLKALFPAVQEMHASLGELHGDAKLTAVGNSLAALAGTSNGKLLALMSRGTVSKYIMEEIGLNIGEMVVGKLFGDKQVELNCMAADFNVTNGLMRPVLFLVDTDNADVRMDGSINLANEHLDLTVYQKSKGIRVLSLRTPIYLKGTFKNPDVGVNKTVLGLKAGAAAALGAAATPFAALLALVQPDTAKASPCGVLLPAVKRKEATLNENGKPLHEKEKRNTGKTRPSTKAKSAAH
jgi:hypothetical protein